MISGGILLPANVPDSFNARTCPLRPGSGGRDKSVLRPQRPARSLVRPPYNVYYEQYRSASRVAHSSTFDTQRRARRRPPLAGWGAPPAPPASSRATARR
ncbi:hypothetical protein EVAR_13082_1 [Eumeta japonica]|uniref:Uncharacterized protein n=1 Tax=Eumeta variegata TaxID=151549 RepID=A0A4C1U9F1_EUMVA|nr:hypothetical protein EVAR_13082_1 [Eumeta japonica]